MSVIIQAMEREAWEENLTAAEVAALDGGNARFLSVPDEKHEFDAFPELARIQVRGNWITVHHNNRRSANPGDLAERAGSQNEYADALLLVHSERNRLGAICHMLMRSWLPEIDEFLRTIVALESGAIDETIEWNAESFGIDVLDDCYRVGLPGSGAPPVYSARDLLHGMLLCTVQALERLPREEHPFDPVQLRDYITEWESSLFEEEKEIN